MLSEIKKIQNNCIKVVAFKLHIGMRIDFGIRPKFHRKKVR